ncbi:MAG: HAD family hydrolase [Treponema sp.]|nr:HAD family hydrolase [Treponema sp.]
MSQSLSRIKWVHIQAAASVGAVDGRAGYVEEPSGLDKSAGISGVKLLRNIKGIIFDFDGTLFDNARIAFHLIAANPLDSLRIWKERLIRKRFAGCDYASPEEYYRVFFAAMGKACHRSPERMRNWYFNKYMPRMVRVLKKHHKPRPGVSELLQRFADGKAFAGGKAANTMPKIAVYSDYPFLRERLAALGLCSDAIPLYGPESFGAQKPATGPFLRIAGDLGVAPEEVLVVGDREETDGLGAFHAGMRFFCLETGLKRYVRLDPYHRRAKKEPQGPSLVMYAGTWESLYTILKSRLEILISHF